MFLTKLANTIICFCLLGAIIEDDHSINDSKCEQKSMVILNFNKFCCKYLNILFFF